MLPGSAFGTGGEGFVRVAFGKRVTDDLIQAGVRIKSALADNNLSAYQAERR